MSALRNNEARSCNYCCSGKAIIVTYCDCEFVALGIEHAMCMRHIVICGLPCCTHFSTLRHKRHDLKKKVTEHEMCVSIFSTTFACNIFHSKKNWADRIENNVGRVVKYLLLLSDINTSWTFSTDFRKTFKYQISWKFVPLEASCSMRRAWRTDGRTDRQTWRN